MKFLTWTKVVCLLAVLIVPSLVDAQSTSFPLRKPLPTHRPLASGAAPAALTLTGTASATSSAPKWQPLNNQPTFLDDTVCYGAANPLLLTDGTVIVQNGGCTAWWRLTPDINGSYVNGTWSPIASLAALSYSPLYHSSAVLPDGRVIIEGGEYNYLTPVWANQGAIYDPIADSWLSVAPPSGWTTIGDAQSVVLANGTYMQANCCTTQAALLNPATLTWTPTGTGKYDVNDEEGWTLLPNRLVLAVDAYVPIGIPYMPTGTNSELYNPGTGTWQSAGSTIVQLWDSAANCGGIAVATFELGPAVLRPDGTVFYAGANSCGAGNTAIYNSHTGKWTAGPTFPGTLNIADGPAALLPNGHVLVDASPGFGNTPSSFFEWDGTNLIPVAAPPNAAVDSSFYGNMLVLPTGQILFTDFSDDIEIYTSSGGHQPIWAPIVLQAPSQVSPGGSYELAGILLNGMSQGSAYGDDAQAATNYPIVRITNNKTGHVFYSRTHDHSSMAVASPFPVVTHFDVPAAQEVGPSQLVVVANGIPSLPVHVNVR